MSESGDNNQKEETATELPQIHEKVEDKVIKLDNYNRPPPQFQQQGPPQFQQQGPPPGYNYYNQGQGQYGGTPMYQQRLDGQNVYYVSPPPQNVSRRGEMFHVRRDSEDAQYGDFFITSFDSIKIRNQFVQRVYTILAIQLFITFGFVFLGVYEENTKLFIFEHAMLFSIMGMIVYLVTVILLVCVQSLRRTVPINFILLMILTLGLTMVLMVITATADTYAVLFAVGTTALVCLLVSLFACQTKWDVTGCGMCLCIAMIVLFVFGLILMVMMLLGYYIKWLHIVFSALATLLFTFWLMYDTQLIMGGRHVELSPEEYIYGALTLYIDIVYIFIHILTLYELCR